MEGARPLQESSQAITRKRPGHYKKAARPLQENSQAITRKWPKHLTWASGPLKVEGRATESWRLGHRVGGRATRSHLLVGVNLVIEQHSAVAICSEDILLHQRVRQVSVQSRRQHLVRVSQDTLEQHLRSLHHSLRQPALRVL